MLYEQVLQPLRHIYMAGETFMAILPFEGIGFDQQNNIAAC